MADEDRIEGRDVYGARWCAGSKMSEADQRNGLVAWIGTSTSAGIDAVGSARLARFLLKAAKVDIVGAARKARERFADPFATEDERRDAMHALASELAKLDAMVGHDMSEAQQEK